VLNPGTHLTACGSTADRAWHSQSNQRQRRMHQMQSKALMAVQTTLTEHGTARTGGRGYHIGRWFKHAHPGWNGRGFAFHNGKLHARSPDLISEAVTRFRRNTPAVHPVVVVFNSLPWDIGRKQDGPARRESTAQWFARQTYTPAARALLTLPHTVTRQCHSTPAPMLAHSMPTLGSPPPHRVDGFRRNYSAVVERLRGAAVGTVVLATSYSAYYWPPALTEPAAEAVRREAAVRGWPLLDLKRVFEAFEAQGTFSRSPRGALTEPRTQWHHASTARDATPPTGAVADAAAGPPQTARKPLLPDGLHPSDQATALIWESLRTVLASATTELGVLSLPARFGQL
jgi:hypothetical protein